MSASEKVKKQSVGRYLVLLALVAGVFFGAYRFADARGAKLPVSTPGSALAVAAQGTTPPCACCGSSAPTKDGITGDVAEGTATLEGGVQRISVDLSKGYYDPNVIVLRAGVPAEITFGQGTGCTSQVISEQLGFSEDLSAGPRNVNLPALDAGEYSFSCGMGMVFGKIVVK